MEQIRLDIVPKGIMPVCHASQYDKGRVIRCNLMDGLQGYVLTTETIVLNVRKPDDNIVTAAVEVVSGKTYVDIVTTEQMTACEGNNICELTMSKGDVVISTLNFKMQVEVDPLKDGIESETEIHNLTTQIQDINAEVVPPIVAEEVANQYDSANVIFDDHPTAGHGTGYVVKSENVPDELNALNDVSIDTPSSNQALVWDAENNRWTNGEVSTVGGLNDLNDVTLSDVQDKQELVYNGTDQVFKNKTTRIELTQAQYDALANPLPDVDYYITDAPSMSGSSKDLSYDGTTKSTYTKIEEVVDYIDSKIAVSDITSSFNIDTTHFSASTKQLYKSGNVVNICLRGNLTATNGTILGTIANYYPKASRIICDFHNNGAPTPITTGAVWLNGENGRMYYFGGSVSNLDVCITATYICN